ncbi:LOW QUALITY PROTEIN: hypothetical protein ACG7TL_006591 [Trametes sanguinea]
MRCLSCACRPGVGLHGQSMEPEPIRPSAVGVHRLPAASSAVHAAAVNAAVIRSNLRGPHAHIQPEPLRSTVDARPRQRGPGSLSPPDAQSRGCRSHAPQGRDVPVRPGLAMRPAAYTPQRTTRAFRAYLPRRSDWAKCVFGRVARASSWIVCLGRGLGVAISQAPAGSQRVYRLPGGPWEPGVMYRGVWRGRRDDRTARSVPRPRRELLACGWTVRP